jgi:hypothetical protein
LANQAIGKILRYERIYNRKKDVKSTFVMALSYFVAYAITGQRDLLHKANFVLSRPNFSSDFNLTFMRCFIAFELENYDVTEELLGQLRPKRNAMKSHQPTFYAHYLYFDCLLALTKQKGRAANKHYRNLRDFVAASDLPVQNADLLMANLNLVFGEYSSHGESSAFGDYDTAFKYLHKAYKTGERSPLFFICLARVFARARPRGDEAELLLPLVLWALNTGCYIEGIIEKNQSLAESLLRKRPKMAENMYEVHPADWILHIITTARMINNDTGSESFYYYKEAEVRQLHFPQLYDFLIRSAYKNEIEDIRGYPLVKYIETQPNIPDEILPFVYHLVLKGVIDNRHDEILAKIKPDIIKFACEGLGKHLYGRYYYSTYKFLLDVSTSADADSVSIDKNCVEAANEIVKNLLFSYDIKVDNERAARILIQEEHKKQEDTHELKDGRLRINLWSPHNVKITCFDESMRNIIPGRPKVQRLIENVDITLYKRLFAEGHNSQDLTIFLADYYLNQNQENIPHEAILVYEAAAALPVANRAFARLVKAALGNFYARGKNFKRAVEYFKDLDEAAINKNYLEQMLLAYMNDGDVARVTRIIARLAGDISDKTLFSVLKQVGVSKGSASLQSVSAGQGSMHPKKDLAAVALRMLTRGWYAPELLELVLTHYAAPLPMWIELSKSLANLGIFEAKLHEKILDTAILTRSCGRSIQTVFVQLFKNKPDSQKAADFAVYLAYEIIINDIQPEPSVVLAMEEIFVQGQEAMVAYALAHVYIKERGAVTQRSKEILAKAIEEAMDNDFIFPIFKEIKDKNVILPYIEKNRPFVYRGHSNSEVTLHYKIKDEGDGFLTRAMRYLAFGLFVCHVPHFFGEEIEFYFVESRGSGSIKTANERIVGNAPHLLEKSGDLFYTINNALIYEQMFKYERVEEIVTARLAEKVGIRAKMM